MSLILNQGLASQYTFPSGFSIDAPPWAKRLNELERAYKHGAAITGDEMVKARPLRVWGVLYRTTRTLFQSALDDMERACYLKGSAFHATDHWTDRYLTVDCANFSIDYLVTLFAADVDILFRVVDPFWYSDTLSSHVQSGTSSGGLGPAPNNTGPIEVSPTIFIYVATGTITAIDLVNHSDLSRTFNWTGNLTVGRGIRIRCAQGQIHRWTGTAWVDGLSGFDGTFYRLQPGENHIVLTLTGVGTVDITHQWRTKWLG